MRVSTLPLDAARIWGLRIGETSVQMDEKVDDLVGGEAKLGMQRMAPTATTRLV